MHEVTVAQAIIEQLKKKLGSRFMSVRTVYLRVGRLTCINEDALQFAFSSFAATKEVPEIDVVIDWVDAVAECLNCYEKFSPNDQFLLMCPKCGGLARLLKGDELHLVEAELTDDGAD